MEQNKTLAKQLNINKFPFYIEDNNGNEIYYENYNGLWIKKEFDQYNQKIYYESSNGLIEDNKPKTLAKQLKINNFAFGIIDNNGNIIYYEDSKGYWYRIEFDGNQPIYYENSIGSITKYVQNRSCTKIYQYTKPSFLRRLFNGIKNFLEI
jgi:hypothetical protein